MRAPLVVLAALLGTACSPPAPPHDAGLGLRPDNPDAAQRWRALRWADENGLIPEGAWRKATAAREANLQHWRTVEGPTAGIESARWTERGPEDVGGRTRAFAVDPRDENHLWAGSVGGGLWQSSDGGQSWAVVDDFLRNLAVGAIALEPGNPDVIYIGTGEGYYNADAVRGEGVFKSTDGGKTFRQLPQTAGWRYVLRLAVSTSNPQHVLAGIRPGGLMRSTDGGANWSSVLQANSVPQVVIDPATPANVVASVLDDPGLGYANMVYRVAYSRDGGSTWKTTQAGLSRVVDFGNRIELAWAPSRRGMVYASCGKDGGKVWVSTDYGVHFSQVTLGSESTNVGWYYNALWVDPTDETHLLVGAYHVQRSRDGGATFQNISSGYIKTTDPHPDVHAFVPEPGFDGQIRARVYVATDGGVFFADDIYRAGRGQGWSKIYDGYRTSQFYGAAGHGPSGRIVGGTQDNGTLTLDPGSNLSALTFGGDGGFCAIDRTDPDILDLGQYVWLRLHRSTDGGQSARYIHSGITETSSGSANFIAPFVLDPNDPRRLLAGGRSLWVTADARAPSPSWTVIKPPASERISAIAVANTDSNVVWVGHNDGQVWRTSDALSPAPTWTVVDDNGASSPLPDRYVTRLLVDDADPRLVYASFGGFNADNLWRTADGGATFTTLVGTAPAALPPAPIYGIARHPLLASHLYVATEVGIFASEDHGASWATTNLGPANVSVDEIRFLHDSETLVAATHGRGLWTIDVATGSITPFGQGCGVVLGGFGGLPPTVGGSLILQLDQLVPGQPFALLFGSSNTSWNGAPLPLDLSFAGLTGCSLLVSAEVVLSAASPSSSFVWPLPVPADPSLVGATLYAQAAAGMPGANTADVVLSNGVASVIGS